MLLTAILSGSALILYNHRCIQINTDACISLSGEVFFTSEIRKVRIVVYVSMCLNRKTIIQIYHLSTAMKLLSQI